MTITKQKTGAFLAIQIKEFRYLLLGRFTFIIALRMLSTLLGWWIFNLTNAPFAIGIIGLSEFLPAVSFALYAGHIIDKSEKRKMMLRGIGLYFLAVLVLLLIASPLITNKINNTIVAILIYVTVFCTGIIRSFTGPVFSVILANIVPKDILQNATTFNQGTFLSASVIGHLLGGIFIAIFGNMITLTIIALLMFFSFFILHRINPQPPMYLKNNQKTWESVKEGLNFVFKTKELLGALSLDLFAVLFGGAVAMVPVYAKTILNVDAKGFGLLNGASDIGAIFIVVLLTIFPIKKQQGKKLLFAVAGFGLCIIIFGLSKIYWISFLALMFSGILDGISVVTRGTIMQLKTPNNMRGRVMSVNSMFVNSSNELGQFESGTAAKLMGTVPSVVFGGCITLFVVAITWIKAPSLRKMEY